LAVAAAEGGFDMRDVVAEAVEEEEEEEEEEEPKLSEGKRERLDFVFVAGSGGWVDIMICGGPTGRDGRVYYCERADLCKLQVARLDRKAYGSRAHHDADGSRDGGMGDQSMIDGCSLAMEGAVGRGGCVRARRMRCRRQLGWWAWTQKVR
jgi:hypothetical protein